MKGKFISVAGFILLLSAGLTLNNCRDDQRESRKGELSGHVSLSGAFALYPLAVKWAEEFRKIHPDVKIEIDGGGAGKGMTDVLANQVDFGMISREVKPSEEDMGALYFPVAKDAVVPTISVNNPYFDELMKHGITVKQAKEIWISGKIKTWGQLLGGEQKEKIAVFTRSDACGAAETFAAWMGKHQEDLLGEGVNSDPCMATTVMKNACSIGLNNIGYVYDNTTNRPFDGIRVLPIDVNENGQIDAEEDFYATRSDLTEAIRDGRFPLPPARYLYLVTRGVPTNPLVVAFLKFVMDKGQEKNEEAGYVAVAETTRKEALKKLK